LRNIEGSAVTVDGIIAVKNIIRHFKENGTSELLTFQVLNHLNISKNRKEGYLKGLKECGLEFHPELLVECNLSANEAALPPGNLLSMPKTTRCDFWNQRYHCLCRHERD
jgi:DNA-binding LacI/PurR family transcriptional regulator